MCNKMLSVVVPTSGRINYLKGTLMSILAQTILPNEVIVVDDSRTEHDNEKTQALIRKLKPLFEKKEITLTYLKNNREQCSLAICRNLGSMNSSGEIVFFFDNDILLNKGYMEAILEVYEKYPDAAGVSGWRAPPITEVFSSYSLPFKIINTLAKGLGVSYFEKDLFKINTYPHILTRIIPCEIFYGASFSLRKDILRQFHFDEKLKGVAHGEDVDLSYRISRKHKLYIAPLAKYVHRQSQKKSNRKMGRRLAIYLLYVHYKLFPDRNLKTDIMIFKRIAGLVLARIFYFLVRPTKQKLFEIINTISGVIYSLKYLDMIRKGKIENLC